MITMAQRIEALRVEKGLSRPQLSAALGLPKSAMEKFETGRQTPTQDQQKKLADYFGVSLFYLRGESDDRTRMESWLSGAVDEPPAPPRPAVPAPRPASRPAGEDGPMLSAIFKKQVFSGDGACHRVGGAALSGGRRAGAQSRAQGTGAALIHAKEREGLENLPAFFCLLL